LGPKSKRERYPESGAFMEVSRRCLIFGAVSS
jgi:hypothetical protein